MTDRKSLNFGDLDDFKPRPKAETTNPRMPIAMKAVDRVAGFPSREALDEGQLNIKAPRDVLDRFKAMAKAERYKYGDFLEILMNSYEGR